MNYWAINNKKGAYMQQVSIEDTLPKNIYYFTYKKCTFENNIKTNDSSLAKFKETFHWIKIT